MVPRPSGSERRNQSALMKGAPVSENVTQPTVGLSLRTEDFSVIEKTGVVSILAEGASQGPLYDGSTPVRLTHF